MEGEVFFISSSNEIILQGGLACVVGRQFNQNAISHITGKSDSIEKGDIGKWDLSKGITMVLAFQSYMWIDRANNQKKVTTADRERISGFDMSSI